MGKVSEVFWGVYPYIFHFQTLSMVSLSGTLTLANPTPLVAVVGLSHTEYSFSLNEWTIISKCVNLHCVNLRLEIQSEISITKCLTSPNTSI